MAKKFLLFIAIALLTVQTASAKKFYYSMQQITGIADLVVTGKIISVSGNSYSFAIEQTIKGKPGKQIIIKMFAEWTCDIRSKKVEVGQELLLFLTNGAKDSFDIINGSTGEIFIENNKLHNVWGLKEDPSLIEVITGLKNFVACYTVLNKELFPNERIVFKKIKADAEILRSRNINEFSTWLFDNMKHYSIKPQKDLS